MRSRLHEMCKKVEMEGPDDNRQHTKQAHFQRIQRADTDQGEGEERRRLAVS